ncbi:MAG TPA: UDP-N-acetylglucosamine 2-epimerase (non-hydrolyzing) [Firmicutes bacterium]|jgi:UDP-GlcNAc3NAcA epimerase|nr:UDP-N-acetylglucosamine 2-epimerase (non-hydrolyzing) [Bacillota bacterium]
MKVLTIVGARPQFVKAAVVSEQIRQNAREVLVHTGQHYDLNMSDIFFQELGIPTPDYHLGIGSGPHGAQTGKMLEAIEQVINEEQPDRLLIYGDTNSTLAGALAAAKLHVPIAHVEAGLRSFNRRMPEEVNRVVADHLASWLFAPTQTAITNLAAEGITKGVYRTGDVMYDAFLRMSKRVSSRSRILDTLRLRPKEYYLLTLHRAENTDDREKLQAILGTLAEVKRPVIFPIHPRTRSKLSEYGLSFLNQSIQFVEPVGYFDMLNLELNAEIILTDSGGVQKEAYMAKTPCITLRDETEWVETVTAHWNCLVGSDPVKIREALALGWLGSDYPDLFGDGAAAAQIAKIVDDSFSK